MNRADLSKMWAFAEDFSSPSPYEELVREQAQMLGAEPVSASVADALTVFAAAKAPAQVVDVGCGGGVATLALLKGMPAGSALTALEIDPTRAQATRTALAQAGYASSHRTRVITGDARDVLLHLSDAAYDLAFVDIGDELAEAAVYQCLNLLKPGGLLLVHRPLGSDGAVATPSRRDEITVSLRRMLTDIAACAQDVHVSLLPVGAGLFAVQRIH
ncbi:O-methyltransferase [Rothia nasimurium]|uniref:O-methyltransferase n=1 Tax=Rothia nasimurium TaxID=85336 RepID=UPI003BA353FA